MILLVLYLFLATTNAEPCYENSTNICQKCTCTIDAQAFTLDCTDKNFSCMLANWPQHNSRLKASFVGNNFTSLERLPETDAVVEVILSRCNIQVLYPGIFEGTKNVKFVDLSHNSLTSEHVRPENFRGPYEGNHAEPIAIEHLNLAYNQIHTLDKDIFEYLPNLTRLNLEGNDFVVLDAQTQLALSSVRGLHSLNLANNELTELVAAAVESFDSLVELDLSKNSLDFVPHSLDNVGQSLEILILDDNPIIELTAVSFSGLTKLIEVSANNLTKLKYIDSGTFASNPNLTKLKLCNNNFLREINAEAFSTNSTIKELYLNNNSLTNLPFALLNWQQLDTLEMSNNPFDCSCDLYNISVALSGDITRDKSGPMCMDPRTDQLRQVYSLEKDMCSSKLKRRRRPNIGYRHISIQLSGLLVTLTIGLLVAAFLGGRKYKRFIRTKNNPYASQVIYSPLLNARS